MAADASTGLPGFLPGINQADPRADLVDLGPGYLDPALIPVAAVRDWADRALTRWGAQALGYGANPGPWELRVRLAARLSAAGRVPCGPDEVLTTPGTSAALDQLAVRFAEQRRSVLTEALTYDLGRLIFQRRGVRTVAVPGPLDDLDVDEIRRYARREISRCRRPPALYLIPTLHNPTGRVLSVDRRRELVAAATDLGLLVVEDQAYAELLTEPVPSLRALAPDAESVVSLYSLSKTLAPGLRLGWLVGGGRLVAELAEDAVRRSGGGPNHLAAMVFLAACDRGGFDRHILLLRRELDRRRDTLVRALAGRLPDGFVVTRPPGGFFAWVGLPPGVDDRVLLREAEARGLSFTPGRRFGSARGARLCFAACGAGRLRQGARLFVAACRAVKIPTKGATGRPYVG